MSLYLKLYYSFNEMKKSQNIEDMGLYFCMQHVEDKRIVTEDLIKNGSHIQVTSSNVDYYIEKR